MKHERAQHRASIVAFFKHATLDEIRALDEARLRILAARIAASEGSPTCCPWHRSGGIAAVACRDTISDDGGWNDGAAAQSAAFTPEAPADAAPYDRVPAQLCPCPRCASANRQEVDS